MPVTPVTPPGRNRLALDLSPTVASHLDRISAVLGVPKSQIVTQALIEALPALLERAEGLAKVQGGKGAKR